MISEKTGRTLDLLAMLSSSKKVTLGFKCDPELKMRLASEAQSKGLSLSEYVEQVAKDRFSHMEDIKIENDLMTMTEKINHYENSTVHALFLLYNGKVVEYTTYKGEKKAKRIEHIEEIFTIIMDTFDTECIKA